MITLEFIAGQPRKHSQRDRFQHSHSTQSRAGFASRPKLALGLLLAETFIPASNRESQPFFNNAARDIVTGVIVSLQRLTPRKWNLRDVLLILSDEKRLRRVLNASEHTSH